MKNVLVQYAKHIIRILTRARAKDGKLTNAQRKRLAYYKAAAERTQALMYAETPKWVFVKFEKKLH